MNHQTRKSQILEEAQSMGLSTKDLRILTTDPYLVGTDGEYRDARWAARLWDEMMRSRKQPLHLRGFHYWVQSRRVAKPNGKIYGDDPMKDWRWLLKAAQVSRYLRVGEWKGLLDMKHPNVKDYDEYSDDTGLYMTDQTVEEVMRDELTNIVDTLMERARYMAPRYITEGYQTYHT